MKELAFSTNRISLNMKYQRKIFQKATSNSNKSTKVVSFHKRTVITHMNVILTTYSSYMSFLFKLRSFCVECQAKTLYVYIFSEKNHCNCKLCNKYDEILFPWMTTNGNVSRFVRKSSIYSLLT